MGTDIMFRISVPAQGLNWDLLSGGGGLCGIELIYIYITFSNLADTFIQSDLQMRTRTMEIYMYCVCVCVCVCLFANMI